MAALAKDEITDCLPMQKNNRLINQCVVEPGESNPRPQALYSEIYILSPVIWF
jgi:hypothetical protein